jgi:hypothetical protein
VGTRDGLDVVRNIDPNHAGKRNAGSWIRSQSPGKPQTQACGILKYPVVRQNVCCGFRQCIVGLHLKTAPQKHIRAIICTKHVAAYVFCCYLEKRFKEQHENPSWFSEQYHPLCTNSSESNLNRKCKILLWLYKMHQNLTSHI